MSVAWIVGIAVGAYGWKAFGLLVLSRLRVEGPLAGIAAHLPAALFAGLITQQVLGTGTAQDVSTRLAGVVAGGVLAWRRVPLLAVIVTAAGVTALARLAMG